MKKYKTDVIILTSASILFKVFLIFLTVNIFHSFIDGFDLSIYQNYATQILSGHIPYIDFSLEYPPFFFIPVIISMLFGESFGLVFAILMALCDVVTVLCVYFIGLKIYDRKKALLCGIICACSFPVYFSITKYDAFPTMLMLLSIYMFLNSEDESGYFTSTVGMLTKWFPFVTTPIFMLTNLKSNSKISDIFKKYYKSLIFSAFVFIPIILFGSKNFISMHLERGSQSVSFPFLIDYITNTTIFSNISTYLTIMFVIVLLYWYYKLEITSPKILIYFITAILFTILLFNKVLSPQYFLWIIPLLSLTLVDGIDEIISNYILQAIIFIEFPLTFGVLYVNDKLYDGLLPPLFFAIKHATVIVLLYIIYKKIMNNEHIINTTKGLVAPSIQK